MQRHGLQVQGICASCSIRFSQSHAFFATNAFLRPSNLRKLQEEESRENKSSKTNKYAFYRPKLKQSRTFRDPPNRSLVTDENFKTMVLAELKSMSNSSDRQVYRDQLGIRTSEDFIAHQRWLEKTKETVEKWDVSGKQSKHGSNKHWLQLRLWTCFVKSGKGSLSMQLRYIFQDTMANSKYSSEEIMRQAKCGDLRFPAEWYIRARQMDREIHLHIGPTNSGKTYHALKRLQSANIGVYGGPLRLLAHEVHGRMLAAGRSCNMITGDERIKSDDPNCGLVSSTVEMIPMSIDYDVAVVDEIQMMADSDRGSAWTEAFLGLRAKELHLCGEARVLPLIKQLAVSTGDKLIVHEYKRLSPLEVADDGLDGDLNQIRAGDCLVAFSRAEIHNYRNQISNLTGKNVAVVYGTLPPETRAEQARLFNDPDSGYDVLVASNAIGMGLNLSIKRIIFSTRIKFNGYEFKELMGTEVKQIGGRAGRYRSSYQQENKSNDPGIHVPEDPSIGSVTTLRSEDLSFVRRKMMQEPEPISKAFMKIPDDLVIRFASYFAPDTPLTYILLRLRDVARMGNGYALAEMEDELKMAEGLAVVKNLSLQDRLIFCCAPTAMENQTLRRCVIEMARCVAESRPAELFTLPIPIEVLNVVEPKTTEILKKLEDLHRCLTLYMWLSYRFTGIFTSQAVAHHSRTITEQRISETLTRLAKAGIFNSERLRRRRPDVLSWPDSGVDDFGYETKEDGAFIEPLFDESSLESTVGRDRGQDL